MTKCAYLTLQYLFTTLKQLKTRMKRQKTTQSAMKLTQFIKSGTGFTLYPLASSVPLTPSLLQSGDYSALPLQLIIQPHSPGSPAITPLINQLQSTIFFQRDIMDTIYGAYALAESNFYAVNHKYTTQHRLVDDPCIYKIVDGFTEEGKIDLCTNTVSAGNWVRKYSDNGSSYRFTEAARKESKQKDEKKNENALKIFVFNGVLRLKKLKNRIARDTKEIVNEVSRIFARSKAPVSIEFSGSLSFTDAEKSIVPAKNTLFVFKMLISPDRFSFQNLKYPLGTADVVFYLENAPKSKDKRELVEHGKSFYGGSISLRRSYGVVFTDENESNDLIARKMAHEIGHMMGCYHDKEPGHVMESPIQTEPEEVDFSSYSMDSMRKFVEEYKDVFKETETVESTAPIMSLKEAREFVKRSRKHPFYDIVATRLNGIPPEKNIAVVYILISLCLYIVCIVLAIYHLG